MKIVYSTFASKSDFEHMAELLLANGLIACANGWEINSMYSADPSNDVKLWKGKEYAGFFKTTWREYKKTCDFIAKNHKYSNPAIISIDCSAMSKAYGSWLEHVCSRTEIE